MPTVDLTDVTDYPSFERAFNRLLDVLDENITKDHLWKNPDGGESTPMYRQRSFIGEQPDSFHHYVAIEFVDEETVKVTWAERGIAEGWSERCNVNQAMRKATANAITSLARRFELNTGQNADAEDSRLWRVLDDQWAEQ